jgi:hypothetical protein
LQQSRSLTLVSFKSALQALDGQFSVGVNTCMHKLAMLIYGVLRSGVPFDIKRALPALDIQDGI